MTTFSVLIPQRHHPRCNAGDARSCEDSQGPDRFEHPPGAVVTVPCQAEREYVGCAVDHLTVLSHASTSAFDTSSPTIALAAESRHGAGSLPFSVVVATTLLVCASRSWIVACRR